MKQENEDIKGFGKSKKGNFSVKDKIGVPHPYCITPKHLTGDQIYINEETIRQAEEKGATCDICRKLYKQGKIPRILSFDEHKQALLIECKKNPEKEEYKTELQEYLLKIKEKTEKKGFAGWAFLNAWSSD